MLLLDAVTANGSGTSQNANGVTNTVFAWGTWDGASVTLEMSPDEGTTWIAHTDLAFTENSVVNVNIAAGVDIRGTVASAGGSTSVSLSAR